MWEGTVYIPADEYDEITDTGRDGNFIINGVEIPEGYYSVNQIVKLLRDNSHNPEVVYFIADMMEK
jgi:hypothetical protein